MSTGPFGAGVEGIVPMLRDLYYKYPELRDLKPWELQSALFVFGLTDELLDEPTIARALEAAAIEKRPAKRPGAAA